MANDNSVTVMLGGAVASLFGALVWLYRSTLERAYKRIDVLEGRERELLAIAKALESLEQTLNMLVEIVKERAHERRRGGP